MKMKLALLFALLLVQACVSSAAKEEEARLAELARIEKAHFDRMLNSTPHQLCSAFTREVLVEKHGTMAECKADMVREQTAVRAELTRRASEAEARRNMAIQILLSRPPQ